MKIGAVLCARNEAHIIEEWVAHHLAIGVNRIHVFDHMSTDGTREKLDHIHTNEPNVTVQTWNPNSTTAVQRLAYDQGLVLMTKEDVDWCAFIDADEFIGNGNVNSSETLETMLSRHSEHCAIALNWTIFGSSGHIVQPPGMIQENFLYRSIESFSPNRHIKSLVRPRYTMGAHHAHGFSLEHRYFTLAGAEVEWRLADDEGNPVMPYALTSNTPQLNNWRLNHYFCQWRGRWDAKVARSKVRGSGSVIRSEKHWEHHNRNEVFDPSALRWTTRDKKIMQEITG